MYTRKGGISYENNEKDYQTINFSFGCASPDIDDVILNTVGTFIGCGFYRMIKNIKLKDR